jgi:hypothetical protein
MSFISKGKCTCGSRARHKSVSLITVLRKARLAIWAGYAWTQAITFGPVSMVLHWEEGEEEP